MAAIGLLDIPPELQLQIAEFVETRQALKALSVTSRSLRSIAQSMLFKKLAIYLGKDPRGLVDDLLANPRICAAIRFLEVNGWCSPYNHDERLSHIQKFLPKMVGLRQVSIKHVDLSKAFLDAFLEIAANKPLQITLEYNSYPYGVISTSHTPLQISHLQLILDDRSLEFCRSMFHASATTLTRLRILVYGDEFMRLPDINLPSLHDLTLSFLFGCETFMTSAAAFITAQNAIKKLELRGSVCPLPPIPPNALLNLRELKASPKLVNQLVPSRPVEAIEVISTKYEEDQNWFGEEVTQSTARVRMLRVHLLETAVLDMRMVKRMVTILPLLENLWFPVFDDVSWPFRSITKTLAAHFLQTLLNVVEVLTSLKCLKSLGFELVRREVWVDLNVNDIAIKLRNANSSFSYLEIQDDGGRGGWKLAIFVWNEVFGVFHRMESATARYY